MIDPGTRESMTSSESSEHAGGLPAAPHAFAAAVHQLEVATGADPALTAAPGRRQLRRWLVVVAVLGAGLAVAWWVQRDPSAPRVSSQDKVVFVDVEGWYRRTPNEVAVRTPFDWRFEGLAQALPLDLGPWTGRERRHDPAVDVWFDHPEVSIERTYRRADGSVVWFSAFGSRGDKSFHLFEHTPDTCYPLAGWAMQPVDLAQLPLGPRPFPLNHAVAAGPEGQLVVFFFYLWDTPARDAQRGVLSLRIAAPVRQTAQATYAMLAEDFLPRMFLGTLSWRRF